MKPKERPKQTADAFLNVFDLLRSDVAELRRGVDVKVDLRWGATRCR